MKLRPVPLLLLVVALAACGASARQTAIRDTYTAVKVADAAFIAYDQEHRSQIETNAKMHGTQQTGQSALDAWDVTVGKVTNDFKAAYAAIGAAAALDDDPSVLSMVQAALVIRTELSLLGVVK